MRFESFEVQISFIFFDTISFSRHKDERYKSQMSLKFKIDFSRHKNMMYCFKILNLQINIVKKMCKTHAIFNVLKEIIDDTIKSVVIF